MRRDQGRIHSSLASSPIAADSAVSLQLGGLGRTLLSEVDVEACLEVASAASVTLPK